jgi:hypothetical protein
LSMISWTGNKVLVRPKKYLWFQFHIAKKIRVGRSEIIFF